MKQFPSQKPKDSNHSNQKNSDNNRRFTDKIKAASLATLSTTMLSFGGGLVNPDKAHSLPNNQVEKHNLIADSRTENLSSIDGRNIPVELAKKDPNAFKINKVPGNYSANEYIVGLNKSRFLIVDSNNIYFNGHNLKDIKKYNYNSAGMGLNKDSKNSTRLHSSERVEFGVNINQKELIEWQKMLAGVNPLSIRQSLAYNPAQENIKIIDKGAIVWHKENTMVKDAIYDPSDHSDLSKHEAIDTIYIKRGQTLDKKIKEIRNTTIFVSDFSVLKHVKVDKSNIVITDPNIKSQNDIYNILGAYPNTNNRFILLMVNSSPDSVKTAVDTTKAMYDKSVAEQVSRVTGSRVEAPAPERFEEDIRTRLLIEKSPNKYLDENNPDPNDFQLFMEDPNGNYKFSAHLMTKEIEAKKTFFDKAKLKTLPVGQEDNNKDGINETVAEGDVMKIPVFGGPNDRVTIFIKDSNGVDTKVIKRGPAHNIVYNLFRASGSPAGKYKMNIRISDENRKITSDKTYDVVFK